MSTLVQPDLIDLSKPGVSPQAPTLHAKVPIAIRCSLCGDRFEVQGTYRPIAVECPCCGLHFTFEPEKRPLSVPGIRLRFIEVQNVGRKARSDSNSPRPRG